MDVVVQALIMGIVQGLTEFLPISSSGHLIVVPAVFGWTDPFIDSLAFSVMLHLGTLAALLAYFWRDWMLLVPAGFAMLRDRSTRGDPHRRLALNIAISTIPAVIAGFLLNDFIEQNVRQAGLVAIMLLVGASIMWLADRWGAKVRAVDDLDPARALGIGAAQALALVPGISRSGISISAGLFAGLDRASAARFSFLMATPVIAGAGLYELRKVIGGGTAVDGNLVPLVVGLLAAMLSGFAAIHFLLRYLRTNSLAIFVAYRVVLAAIVIVSLLAR
jgi:undecaprenyl-diphosphatase